MDDWDKRTLSGFGFGGSLIMEDDNRVLEGTLVSFAKGLEETWDGNEDD